jgi:hypothetical protein
MPETEEVHNALHGQYVAYNLDIDEMCHMAQWRRFMRTWQNSGIATVIREFDEEQDIGCFKMRMLEIWESQEAMMNGVSARDNSLTFLA